MGAIPPKPDLCPVGPAALPILRADICSSGLKSKPSLRRLSRSALLREVFWRALAARAGEACCLACCLGPLNRLTFKKRRGCLLASGRCDSLCQGGIHRCCSGDLRRVGGEALWLLKTVVRSVCKCLTYCFIMSKFHIPRFWRGSLKKFLESV